MAVKNRTAARAAKPAATAPNAHTFRVGGHAIVIEPSASSTWRWRVMREADNSEVGAGEAPAEADAHAAALAALGIRVDQLAGRVDQGPQPPDTTAAPWDLGLVYGPAPEPWMVGNVHDQLCGIARAAYGLRAVARVLHEGHAREDFDGHGLTRYTVGGLLAAMDALAGVIEGAVDDIDLAAVSA